MKKFNKISVVSALVFSLLLGFAGPTPAHALGTAPDLGVATGYSVFGKAGVTNTGAGTHVWGNAGADSSVGLIASQVDGTINTGAGVAGVETAIQAAYDFLDNGGIQGAPTGLSLSGTVNVTPGVYTVGAALMDGDITLDGAGVYIFRSDSSITATSAAQMNLIGGATACNVFFQVPDAMTIGTGAHIEGTIIANTQLVSLGTGATLVGRAFSRIAQVTLDDNQITEPTCGGTIQVNKIVINDDGGDLIDTDFPLFVDGASVVLGFAGAFSAGSHTVSETTNAQYAQSFSGSCDAAGVVDLDPGDIAVCTITNDDIEQSSGGGGSFIVPPLIEVVKVPSPLALPAGPGLVTYTFTVRNIGPVAMSNVTTLDDTCGPLTLVSGDSNANAVLEVSETWTYTCSATIAETHTNTVTATGWANGINSVDVAIATVVVGGPVPPLIHVVKVPSPLSLPVAGGLVTYTERITNPGTVALSNVTLDDDRCGPMVFISGDSDGDAMLDTSETWTYTCSTNLQRTTTNTATATGQANGITVTDFAIATVVVGVPGLPETGIPPGGNGTPWAIAFAGMLLIVSTSVVLVLRKRTI